MAGAVAASAGVTGVVAARVAGVVAGAAGAMVRVRIASMPPDTSCVNALIVSPTAAGAAAADAAEMLSRAKSTR